MPSYWSTVKASLVNHRDRETQDILFDKVIAQLRTDDVVAFEGGPGTGKSLIAAPLAAVAMSTPGRRVIFSPRTKAQQDVIELETMPRMLSLLPRGFVVLKGRSEYVCLRRATRAGFVALDFRGSGERRLYPEIKNDDWELVKSDGESGCSAECRGDGYELAKAGARTASLVIVNQSVLALNFALDSVILGPVEDDILILDEAHLFAGVMADTLGTRITERRIELAVRAVEQLASYRCPGSGCPCDNFAPLPSSCVCGHRVTAHRTGSCADPACVCVGYRQDPRMCGCGHLKADHTKRFYGPSTAPVNDVSGLFVSEMDLVGHQARWEAFATGEELQGALVDLSSRLSGMTSEQRQEGRVDPDLRGASNRIARLAGDSGYLAKPLPTHAVYVDDSDARSLYVEAKKFDVAADCQELFATFSRAVLMSATMEPLTVKQLGHTGPLLTGPAPFDYRANRLAYVTNRVDDRSGPHQWDPDELVELVRASRSRALVVATANRQKDRAAEALSDAGFVVGVQGPGGGSVRALLAQLKAGEIDVLVGVDSVGTGIDIPGEALSLVVLLSAFNPNAYANIFLKLWGATYPPGRCWPELFAPMALEKLEQAVGRLLRTPEDRGVVAWLDPRSKEIARFRGIVAPSLTTREVADVAAFLS